VIGPGLGRDEDTFDSVSVVLKKVISDEELWLIGDADFLWFLSNSENK
jgi:NAD(P)H-hydrate repair Nnr-like enzyme with NAD(P)H-hydrate dehydratase domain